jgi:hypothetical protein
VQHNLKHPISVSDAIRIAEKSPEDIAQFGVDAHGVHGGLGTGGVSKQKLAAHMTKEAATFRASYGRTPVVVSFTVIAPGPRSRVPSPAVTSSPLVSAAEALPTAVVDESTGITPPPSVQRSIAEEKAKVSAAKATTARTKQIIPGHFPSYWKGEVASQYSILGSGSVIYNMRWDSSTGHNPAKVPSGWGMEIGLTMYNNNNIPSAFPLCGPNGYKNFFLHTWEPATSWFTNLPQAASPYIDFYIESDSCRVNGLEIGIRYPKKLAADYSYWVSGFPGLGEQRERQSAVSASASLKQDNCGRPDPKFVPALATFCMGLNTRATTPKGVAQSQPYVGRNRGWLAPGCFSLTSGDAAPKQTILARPGHLSAPTECPIF